MFQLSIIVQSKAELKLANGSAFILGRSILLPFTGKAISQREIARRRLRSGRIDIDLVNRMLVIKGTVVRRMGFDKRHHQNEWIFLMALDEFACALLDKSGLR